MELRNMTQTELCEKTDIPKSAMSQYLSGSFKPKSRRTHDLAKVLNVSEAWLMGYDVPMERSDTELPLSADFPLSPTQKELIKLLDMIPEDKQQIVLQMIKALVAGM